MFNFTDCVLMINDNNRHIIIINCIRRVAKEVFGESKGKGVIDRDTWWWNEQVQKSLKEKKMAFKEWQAVANVNASLKEEKRQYTRNGRGKQRRR